MDSTGKHQTDISMNCFIRDAAREKLAAITVIEYRDVDIETAKVEVAGYFQMKGYDVG